MTSMCRGRAGPREKSEKKHETVRSNLVGEKRMTDRRMMCSLACLLRPDTRTGGQTSAPATVDGVKIKGGVGKVAQKVSCYSRGAAKDETSKVS